MMHLRVLTQDDASAYWHLREEALLSEPEAFGRDVAEHRETTIAEWKNNIRDMPTGSFILGAFADAELAGIATFSRPAGRKEHHKGYIYGVYLRPIHRLSGNGRELLSALIAKAREDATLEQILLAVKAGDGPANRLYRKLGFESFGVEPRALKIGAEYVDEEQMILWLR